MKKPANEMIWIASFDIGQCNFCFCIEEVNRNELLSIDNIPFSHRYKPNGEPTDEFRTILENIYSNGQIILHRNIDLTKGKGGRKKVDPELFHTLTFFLDDYVDYWSLCSVFVIEEQMKNNIPAIKLAQHCFSYFTIKYGRMKTVIDFPAYHKTRVLGAPRLPGKPYKSGRKRWKALPKYQRKKWAVDMMIEILTSRGEINALNNVLDEKKKDDLADTFLMGKAFQYLVFVEKQFS